MLVRTWLHPMMDQHHDYDGERSYAAGVSARKPPAMKREKSSRVGSVLRKLLGRKHDSSQNIESFPASRYHEGPRNNFPVVNGRGNRSQSLPASKASRAQALRSHAPFGLDPIEPALARGAKGASATPQSKRRLSLPDVAADTPEAFTEHVVAEATALFDADNIGYAVTSGAQEKRRSRSVDALPREKYSTPSGTPLSRSFSDEIQSWRESVGPSQPVDPGPPRGRPPSRALQPRDSTFYNSHSGSPEAENTEKESRDRANYQSYDFQQMATTINEQEAIPIKERMMIAEVKLMDLEHAISKLQQRSGSPPSANTATPRATQGLSLTTTGLSVQTPRNRIAPAVTKSAPGSGSTGFGTDSTQPTAPSLSTATGDDDSLLADKQARHISVETSVHQPEGAPRTATSSETPPSAARTSAQRPLSLTSISIEHFTTLVTLLKREQHARIRLEDELAELRREVFHILHPTPGPAASLLASSSPLGPPPRPPPPSARSPSGGSLYRMRRWDGSRQGMVRIDDFHVAHRRPSYEGEGGGFTGGEFLAADAPPDVYRASTAAAAAGEDDPPRGRPRQSHESTFEDSDTESDVSDTETETETSDHYVTPIETSGRFEIAAGMWGRGEGAVF